MKKFFYSISWLVIFSFQILFLGEVLAQEPEISPDYTFVSKKRISRTITEFTFKASLINHDVAIKNVSAVVTSNSPYTVIIGDGQLNFDDTAANETVVSNNTIVVRQNRTHPFNPDDVQWIIKYDTSSSKLKIRAWFDKWNGDETLVIGKTTAIGTAINLVSTEETEILVNLSQSVSPEQGISLSPRFDNTPMTFESSGYRKYSQQVSAEVAGDYVVTTVMTEPISGKIDTYVKKITVIEQDELDVGITLSTEAYLPLGFNGLLDVGSSVVGNDYKEVIDVSLKILETNQSVILPRSRMVDYIGSIPINTQTMTVGDCLSLQIEVNSTKTLKKSKVEKVCITGFPLELNSEPESFIETSNGTGIALDQLIVYFREGTSEIRIREILNTVGAKVVGTAPSLIFFNIGFNQEPKTLKELQQKKYELDNFFFEVESVSYNLRLGQIQSVLPANDPLLAISGGQESVFQSRADEAWFVTQGDVPIAVIDTGIDLTGHPDFEGKLLAGSNFVKGEKKSYPHDRHGHGSHVAGIIGAKSNNNKGITGYSWNSPLLPIKIARDKSYFWYDTNQGVAIKGSESLIFAINPSCYCGMFGKFKRGSRAIYLP